MDHSPRLPARMIIRRHFDSRVPGTQGSSNAPVVLGDAPGNGRVHPVMAEDDLLTGRPHR